MIGTALSAIAVNWFNTTVRPWLFDVCSCAQRGKPQGVQRRGRLSLLADERDNELR